MKNILYIITSPSIENISTVIFDHDSSKDHVRVLFTQEGVTLPPLASYSCEALKEDVMAKKLEPSCPLIGYSEMVKYIFESDLVITV